MRTNCLKIAGQTRKIRPKAFTECDAQKKIEQQSGAELCQAQIKLELGYTLIKT